MYVFFDLIRKEEDLCSNVVKIYDIIGNFIWYLIYKLIFIMGVCIEEKKLFL